VRGQALASQQGHQRHLDRIDARARAREEAQDGLHRQSSEKTDIHESQEKIRAHRACQKKPIFTNLKKIFEHIELSAKRLDCFLRSNKSNINQWQCLNSYREYDCIWGKFPLSCPRRCEIFAGALPAHPARM